MIARFGLGGRDVADRREEAVVVSVHLLQGGVLDGLEGGSRAFSDEADTGSSNKMRQNRDLESLAIAARS
jgi:hypothetical protein